MKITTKAVEMIKVVGALEISHTRYVSIRWLTGHALISPVGFIKQSARFDDDKCLMTYESDEVIRIYNFTKNDSYQRFKQSIVQIRREGKAVLLARRKTAETLLRPHVISLNEADIFIKKVKLFTYMPDQRYGYFVFIIDGLHVQINYHNKKQNINFNDSNCSVIIEADQVTNIFIFDEIHMYFSMKLKIEKLNEYLLDDKINKAKIKIITDK